MARTTGTASLSDLIRGGTLQPKEKIVIRRRSASPVKGTIQPDGQIRIGTLIYATPSRAAKEALELAATDGWARWRVPRLGDRTLADIRGERS